MARSGKNCKFSELKVLRNAISFHLCNEMESLWKIYWVSNGSTVICDIRLPRSDRNYVASMLMNPPVSITIGTKWWVLLRQKYLFILFVAALMAAAPAHSVVSTMWEAAYVSVTVTSQASGLPRTHGISVAPSGRFPSVRDRPIGSLVARMWPFVTARQMRSFNWECRMCLGELFLQERPFNPLASTALPQIHVWGWHVVDPNH